MGSYVKAGIASELQDGAMKKANVPGQDILLAKAGGKYYAIGNRCPHLGAELAAGKLEGTIVTCPRHGSQFDITNGHNVRWLKGSGPAAAVGKIFKPPRGVPSFKVKIESDDIVVEV